MPPLLARLPAPAIIPLYVSVVPVLVLNTPSPVNAMPRLLSNVNVPVVARVPPLNVKLPGAGVPGAAPRLASADIFSTPPSIAVTPA